MWSSVCCRTCWRHPPLLHVLLMLLWSFDTHIIPALVHCSLVDATSAFTGRAAQRPWRGWAAGKEGGCWQGLQMPKSVSNPQKQTSVIETSVGSDFTPQITPSSYQRKHCVSEPLSRQFEVHKRSSSNPLSSKRKKKNKPSLVQATDFT